MAVAGASGTAADDVAAVKRAARGEEAALAELYDRHSRFVFSLALRIVRDAGEAEDLTQDVFVQLWRQATRFDVERGNVLAWLCTMTRTRAIDVLRRRRVRANMNAPVDEHTAEPVDASPRQDVVAEWSQQAVAIRSAVDSLPLLQRLAVELAFYEGLTHTEIASHLEVPLGTVKTRVRQGLLKIREHLAGVPS